MKKLILSLFIISATAFTATAQVLPNFQFGLKGGVNLSNLSTDKVGAGLDLKAISFDLRYEAGLTSQNYGSSTMKINLFSLAIAYRLIKI